MHRLLRPIAAALDVEHARVRGPVSLAHYGRRGADMEALTRPLWGVVPWLVGGGAGEDVPVEGWVRAITRGVDPDSPGYWGTPGDFDQRWVEACILGVALAWRPEAFWDPLSAKQQDQLAHWLQRINHHRLPGNNWLFFRIMVNLGLRRIGRGFDAAVVEQDLQNLDSYYLGAGWYRDGLTEQRDYYVPTGMHFYGLLYAMLAGDTDPDRAQVFRDRAAAFARDYAAWFGSDGAALPFGRSLTYRFVSACFWPMLALARVEGVDWGLAKGLYLRTLDWWSRQPILTDGGRLTIGFGYPNANLAEGYNAHGSPYWSFKAFAGLALPADHPFWAAEVKDAPQTVAPHAQPHARMILHRVAGEARALCAGQWAGFGLRHSPAKYAKFAYSSRLGLSVPHGPDLLEEVAPDNVLALSEDGRGWRVRGQTFDHVLRDAWCASTWRPWENVTIRTWLALLDGWQVRIHRVETARPLHTAEGGWAVPRRDEADPSPAPQHVSRTGQALACGDGHISRIIDLDGRRDGKVIHPAPNTNLLHPQTALPLLTNTIEPGLTWLSCAARADQSQAPDPCTSQPAPPRLQRDEQHLIITCAHQHLDIPLQADHASSAE